MTRRVCIVSHRLGGYDGVSSEAAKWQWAFRRLGWTVTRAAGYFVGATTDTDVFVAGLWAQRPGAAPPAPDRPLIERICRTHDLLVLDNVGSLPTATTAALALESAALEQGIPTIVRHHDPSWQLIDLVPTTPGFPLHDPRMLHVTINRRTAGDFRQRHPALDDAGALRTIYNTVDMQSLRGGIRRTVRQRMNVADDDVLLVHPARNIERKNIPAALAAAAEIHRRTARRTHYWLTDSVGEIPEAPAGVSVHRGHAISPASLYAAADLVALTSSWEGWGLPVVEAAAAYRPVITSSYPILEEIHDLGISTVDHRDSDTITALLSDPSAYRDFTTANYRSATVLDIRRLPTLVRDAADRATVLMRGSTLRWPSTG